MWNYFISIVLVPWCLAKSLGELTCCWGSGPFPKRGHLLSNIMMGAILWTAGNEWDVRSLVEGRGQRPIVMSILK